jgi:hypothetical protein
MAAISVPREFPWPTIPMSRRMWDWPNGSSQPMDTNGSIWDGKHGIGEQPHYRSLQIITANMVFTQACPNMVCASCALFLKDHSLRRYLWPGNNCCGKTPRCPFIAMRYSMRYLLSMVSSSLARHHHHISSLLRGDWVAPLTELLSNPEVQGG